MSYPYGGPGYPSQPAQPNQYGYQNQPGYPAPYPARQPAMPQPGMPPAPAPVGYPAAGYPPPQAGGGYPQPRPGGGTGITAGILSILGGLASAFLAIGMFALASSASSSALSSGAELAAGARRGGSRGGSRSSSSDVDVDVDFEGIGVFFGIAYGIVALLLLIGGIMLLRRSKSGRTTVIIGCVAFIALGIILTITGNAGPGTFMPVFAILTLILAAIGPTKRWIEAGRTPAMAGYPAAPYAY